MKAMQTSQTYKHKKKKREGNPERKVTLPGCCVQSDQIKYDFSEQDPSDEKASVTLS
jgi:hypothetical protein